MSDARNSAGRTAGVGGEACRTAPQLLGLLTIFFVDKLIFFLRERVGLVNHFRIDFERNGIPIGWKKSENYK